ncbi:MAG TPA: hypothetical protein VNF75_04725 [Candidatus Dormibacteraeota bacterium]|nr:hypothetical protein [Candidatus Dormibacteraeota bacterium]
MQRRPFLLSANDRHPADSELVRALAGPVAEVVLGRRAGGYWLRVWGAWGLRHAGDESAILVVLRAIGDSSGGCGR